MLAAVIKQTRRNRVQGTDLDASVIRQRFLTSAIAKRSPWVKQGR